MFCALTDIDILALSLQTSVDEEPTSNQRTHVSTRIRPSTYSPTRGCAIWQISGERAVLLEDYTHNEGREEQLQATTTSREFGGTNRAKNGQGQTKCQLG